MRHCGQGNWQFVLANKTVTIATERTADGYFGLLDQGRPEFLGEVDPAEWIAPAFGLDAGDLRPDLPLEVVSTGLRYLIVPVASGALPRAHIGKDITARLQSIGAQFAVLLDESLLEVRHWNNDGIVEDIATGSAAGTVGAYRFRHRLAHGGETFILNQGRYTGRPSALRVQPEGTHEHIDARSGIAAVDDRFRPIRQRIQQVRLHLCIGVAGSSRYVEGVISILK